MLCFVVSATMFDRPDSSLTRMRRSLPTRSRVDVLVAGRDPATPLTCMPPLWANALVPTNGWLARKFMLTIS